MRQSWETMTSVSAGHIIRSPTQPVGSGRPQRESNPGPPHQESRALQQSYRAPRKFCNQGLKWPFLIGKLTPLHQLTLELWPFQMKASSQNERGRRIHQNSWSIDLGQIKPLIFKKAKYIRNLQFHFLVWNGCTGVEKSLFSPNYYSAHNIPIKTSDVIPFSSKMTRLSPMEV